MVHSVVVAVRPGAWGLALKRLPGRECWLASTIEHLVNQQRFMKDIKVAWYLLQLG